jgi:hypothetical protein
MDAAKERQRKNREKREKARTSVTAEMDRNVFTVASGESDGGDEVMYEVQNVDVKWLGYPIEESTWEHVSNLQGCQELVQEFEKMRSEEKKRKKKHRKLTQKNIQLNNESDLWLRERMLKTLEQMMEMDVVRPYCEDFYKRLSTANTYTVELRQELYKMALNLRVIELKDVDAKHPVSDYNLLVKMNDECMEQRGAGIADSVQRVISKRTGDTGKTFYLLLHKDGSLTWEPLSSLDKVAMLLEDFEHDTMLDSGETSTKTTHKKSSKQKQEKSSTAHGKNKQKDVDVEMTSTPKTDKKESDHTESVATPMMTDHVEMLVSTPAPTESTVQKSLHGLVANDDVFDQTKLIDSSSEPSPVASPILSISAPASPVALETNREEDDARHEDVDMIDVDDVTVDSSPGEHAQNTAKSRESSAPAAPVRVFRPEYAAGFLNRKRQICILCGITALGKPLDLELEYHPKPWPPEMLGMPVMCISCTRPVHQVCLRRNAEDGECDDEDWRCSECIRWSDPVHRIFVWRTVSAPYPSKYATQTAEALAKNPDELGELTMADCLANFEFFSKAKLREFLIKFKNRSYRAAEWVPETWLSRVNAQLYSQFIRRQNQPVSSSSSANEYDSETSEENEDSSIMRGTDTSTLSVNTAPSRDNFMPFLAEPPPLDKVLLPAWFKVDRILGIEWREDADAMMDVKKRLVKRAKLRDDARKECDVDLRRHCKSMSRIMALAKRVYIKWQDRPLDEGL